MPRFPNTIFNQLLYLDRFRFAPILMEMFFYRFQMILRSTFKKIGIFVSDVPEHCSSLGMKKQI